MDDDKYIFEFYMKHNRFPEDADENQYKSFKDYLNREESLNNKNSENKEIVIEIENEEIKKKKIEKKIVYSTDENIDEEDNYKILLEYIKEYT